MKKEINYIYKTNLGNKILEQEIKMLSHKNPQKVVRSMVELYSSAIEHYSNINSDLYIFFKNKIKKLMDLPCLKINQKSLKTPKIKKSSTSLKKTLRQ